MQFNFTTEQMNAPSMAGPIDALTRCLQCGYCTDICPTYQISGDDNEHSRGRIRLIKEMLENGGRPDDKTVMHIDHCMSCLACMSTCPSFVNYMRLVDHAREYIEENYPRPLIERLHRWTLAQILPHPGRFRLAMRGAQLAKPLTFAMPAKLRGMLELVP